MMSRWFSARLGVALGIASAGIGVALLVLIPAIQWIIATHGWRVAYQALATAVLVCVVPIALLWLKGRPEELGLPRDGKRNAPRAGAGSKGSAGSSRFQVVDPEWANRPWTVGTALRTRRYWMILALSAFNNVAVQMLFVHQVAFMVDGGYDTMLAAGIVGLIGLTSIGSKIGSGWIADRLGREKTWSLGLGMLGVAIVFLIASRVTGLPLLIYLYAIAFAVGYGTATPLVPAIMADVFAGRRFGSIYGVATIAGGVGSAAGALLGGYVFDLSGSYLPAFALALGAVLLSIAAVWLASPGKVRGVVTAPRRTVARG